MTKKCWKQISNLSRVKSWVKKDLPYPKSNDIAVVKASDGWVVNNAGFNGANYYSKNLLVTPSKSKAMKYAKKVMRGKC